MVAGGSLLPLALLALAPLAAADPIPTRAQYCFEGCDTALGGQTFAGSPTADDGYYLELCGNMLHVQSLFLCSFKYCGVSATEIGWNYLSHVCNEFATGLPDLNIVSNYTVADVDALPQLHYGDEPEPHSTAILVGQDQFDLGRRTISVWYDTKATHLWYAKSLFIFWGIVCGLGVVYNAFSWLRASITSKQSTPPAELAASTRASVSKRVWTRVRANLLLPATFGHHCDVPVWQATIPPRIESILIGIFIAINVVLCAVAYHAFENNLYWTEKPIQIWRYFADRTGYLSYANLTILWLFGIRNNILLWATGWQFSTFNRFHRWIARLCVLEAVLHSIAYTVYSFLSGGLADYQESFTEQYWYTGVIATITMSLILGFSVLWLRVTAYEMFLVSHIVLALVTLVNLFYHTKIFYGEFDGFLWPCVAFWVFDRFCRLVRISYVAVRSGFKSYNVQYSDQARVLRVDLTDSMKAINAKGGSNYYIYAPFTWRGWESHPFTLVRWRQDSSDRNSISSASDVASPVEKSSAVVSAQSVSEGTVKYSLLIRPMKGFTSRMARMVGGEQAGNKTSLLVEGAYGHSPDLKRFSDVLYITGGSGISVGISSIYNVLEQNPSANIRLVWTSRNRGLIESVLEKELKLAARSSNVTIDTFVTRESKPTTVAPELCRKMVDHRPSADIAIGEAVNSRRGPLAVVVCGPASLNDDARAAVVEQLKDGQHDVTLFSESFGW